ncbi:nucleotide exchange factor GrpE [Chungangia koreensis]|uniref:Protein GrpE n=1 Tax=Chungangia koreensis TaxID=752657 RepID=A0ABV8X7U3_9LACT
MTEKKDELEQNLQKVETASLEEAASDETVELNNETEVQQPEDETSELRKQIEELKNKLEEEEARGLRARADFENFKRRSNLDRESAEKYRAQKILTNILPVLDNFERALQVEPKTDEGISILKGMDMVYRSLVAAVEEEGLSAIEAEGKEFDPNFHQAVMQEKDEAKPAGIVLAELQKGYMLKDRILRPTMVKVNE